MELPRRRHRRLCAARTTNGSTGAAPTSVRRPVTAVVAAILRAAAIMISPITPWTLGVAMAGALAGVAESIVLGNQGAALSWANEVAISSSQQGHRRFGVARELVVMWAGELPRRRLRPSLRNDDPRATRARRPGRRLPLVSRDPRRRRRRRGGRPGGVGRGRLGGRRRRRRSWPSRRCTADRVAHLRPVADGATSAQLLRPGFPRAPTRSATTGGGTCRGRARAQPDRGRSGGPGGPGGPGR